ncbi:MAG: T9SS type A sorting domain-containing protein [Owenweeksia sp.]
MKKLYVLAVASLLMVGATHPLNAQSCSYDPDNPVVINANTTWNGTQQINSNVEIRNGATLTLYGTVEMLTQGRVIIKPGCKLIINGGHITKNAACVQSWKGIEVVGNASLPQSPMGNQGYLEIKNGGKLSYACNAITNTSHGSGGYNWQTTGGRISAKNAVFENNSRDVVLLTYHSGSGSAEKDYLAAFTDCDFSRNNSYTGSPARSHIALLDVVGVYFGGCIFKNTRTPNSTEDRTALGATNASFYVWASSQRNSRFEGYFRGIMAMGGGRADKEISIRQSDFYANQVGIQISGASNVKAQYNSFSMLDGAHYTGSGYTPGSYGIYLDGTHDYLLSDNYFDDITGQPFGQIGIVALDGFGHTNRIFKNTFRNISSGIAAYNHNRNSGGADGLLIRCNDFDIAGMDVQVRVNYLNNTPINSMQTGMAANQGKWNATIPDLKDLANNLFTPGGQKNWLNKADCWASTYTYSKNEPLCEPERILQDPQGVYNQITLNGINTSFFDYNQNCPSPPLAIDPGDQTTTLAGIQGEDQGWSDESDLLGLLVDNGNTNQLQAQILAAGQPEYQNLYLDLMDMSPYVSVDNLLNLLSIADFPELAVRNILVANPHGARAPEVMEAVYNHQPAFATTTIADIEQGSYTLTSYDVQTGKIASHNYKRHELADLLMASYAEGENAISDISGFLEDRDELLYHYQLVDMELQAGLLSEAQNHLAAIPATAVMQGMESDLHQSMMEYYDVVTACLEDARLITQLNTEEISTLQDMASYDLEQYSLSRNKAIALLRLNGIEAEYRILPPPDNVPGKRTYPDVVRPARPAVNVQAYPNPATDHLIVQWDWLQLGLKAALEIELYDMKGALVLSRSLEDFARNTAVLRLHDQKPASYILRLKSADKVLYSEIIKIEEQ